MNYWEECISIAADECNLKLTKEQLQCLAGSVKGGHENYSMAMGYDAIPNYELSKAEKELAQIKKEVREKENWEKSTRPCHVCHTTGIHEDGWGREVTCFRCGGKGRV